MGLNRPAKAGLIAAGALAAAAGITAFLVAPGKRDAGSARPLWAATLPTAACTA